MRRYFRKLHEYWMAFGHSIGVVATPVQLLLVYVVVFGPARIIASAGRKDLLDRRMVPRDSYWRPREPVGHTLEETRHQF